MQNVKKRLSKNEIKAYCRERGIDACYCGRNKFWRFRLRGQPLSIKSLRHLRQNLGISIAQAPVYA
jgi:hypothetical protein